MAGTHRRQQVLLVATDPDIQQLIQTIFPHDKFDFLIADNAESAKIRAEQAKPALIVIVSTDRSPLNWVRLARTFRQEPPLRAVPIIVLGREDTKRGSRLATLVGINAYFQFPIPPFQLLLTAQELVERRSNARNGR